jgi:predicted aspartyl protease
MAIDDSVVRSEHVPYLPITVLLERSTRELAFEALVDTGYTGFVVIPMGSVASNAAPHHLRLRLADGSSVIAPVYRGRLRIGRNTLEPVAVTELGDAAIVGMQVINRCTLVINHGESLSLEL